MLAIRVEYLRGCAVATECDDRRAPEWPPHPDRLFLAMVDACETLELGEPGRAALRWLERLPSPWLHCDEAWPRTLGDIYVPVNDHVLSKRDGVVGRERERQRRWLPTVGLADPVVQVIWPEAPAHEVAAHAAVLGRILDGVTCLGHSTSMVAAVLDPSPPPPTHRPAERGEMVLRVPYPGRCDECLEQYRTARAASRMWRPLPGMWQAYRPVRTAEAPAEATVFTTSWIVFRRSRGPGLPLAGFARLTCAVREALMSLADPPVPAILSGHAPDGTTLHDDHLAILPLPDLGHAHADGHLIGVGLVLPRTATPEDVRAVRRAAARLSEIRLGRTGVWMVEQVAGELQALRPETWSRPARRWATVTPYLYDRHPKRRANGRAAVIARSCADIGLPPPAVIMPSPYPAVRGSLPVAAFVADPHPVRARARREHLVLDFAAPVAGPVLLGGGRYLGYGLCRPLEDPTEPEVAERALSGREPQEVPA